MRIKQPIRQEWKILYGVVGVLILVTIYSFLSYRQHIVNPTDTTMPNMTQLWHGVKIVTTPRENGLQAAFGVAEDKPDNFIHKFWVQSWKTMIVQDAWATYSRLVKGIVWGCVISVILGTLMGCYEGLAAFLLPVLSFLSKVPGTAMLAVFFVVAGTGETMFIAMIGFGILPTLTQSVYFSARDDLHQEEIDKAYTLGASNIEVIWEVVFPQILPKILDNIRLQFGPAMVFLIAAEMLVGQVGMGYQIRMQQRLLHMNVVYDYIMVLGVTGLLMDKGMLLIRQWYCPWFDRDK
jgi:NitT/TauT family transport system permease protein